MITVSLQEFYHFFNETSPLLAVDIGDKKLGFAISDMNYKMALPIDVIIAPENNDKIQSILLKIESYKPCGVVVGLPFNMDGSESHQTQKVLKLMKQLAQSSDIPIYLQDERLTSFAAHSILKQVGMKRKDRDKIDDQVAASLILETVLSKIALLL
jgi:putative holliday junction resolvase